jgi:hypothetical protein
MPEGALPGRGLKKIIKTINRLKIEILQGKETS